MTATEADGTLAEGLAGSTRSGPRRHGGSVVLPRSAFVVVALAAAVVQVVLARGVFLFWDDYYFLGEARHTDLDLHYLGETLFTHFSPVLRLVNWLIVGHIAAHPWIVAAAVSVMLVAVIAAVTWLLIVLFGRTWPALVANGLLGTSLTLMPLAAWWTAAGNILPGMAAFMVAFAAAVLVVRRGSRWWVVPCLIASALGVLDYETTILLPVYVGLWVLLVELRASDESVAALLRRTWWLWAGLLVISAAATVNYRINYYESLGTPTLGALARGLVQNLVGNVVPTSLGLHAPGSGWFPHLSLIVGWVVLVAGVGWLLATRRGAWRGLLLASAGWLLPTLALLLGRLVRYGPGVADDAINSYLPTALVLIGVVEAMRAPPRASTANRTRRGARLKWTVVPVAAALVVGFVSSVGPTTRYRIPYGADGAFVTAARVSAAETRADIGRFTVVDSLAKPQVMPPSFGMWSRDSNVLAISVPDLVFNSARPPYYRFDDRGTLVPAPVEWEMHTQSGPAAEDSPFRISGANDLSNDADRGNCFSTTPSTVARWQLPTVTGTDLVVRTLLTVDRPSDMVLAVSREKSGSYGYPYDIDPGINVLAPDGTGTLTIVQGPITGVQLSAFTPDVTVCLRSVEVGHVRSAVAPGH